MRYSVEFCEREYNNRLRVPEYQQIFSRWVETGKLFRDSRRADPGTQLHLTYGEADSSQLDYFSCGVSGAPLFVFIHGGYWRSLDKDDFSWVAGPFLSAHIDVAVINYALCPKVSIEDIVCQLQDGCAWLYRNSGALGFDRDSITVGGHSAGAHLAAMMLCADWSKLGQELPPDLTKSALLMSGLYDLEPLLSAPFVQVDLKLDAASVVRLSAAYLLPHPDSSVITAVGGLESDEFKRQNQLIEQHWPSHFLEDIPMPGTDHFTVVDALIDPEHPLTQAAIALCRNSGAA
jgi:arylformamidase